MAQTNVTENLKALYSLSISDLQSNTLDIEKSLEAAIKKVSKLEPEIKKYESLVEYYESIENPTEDDVRSLKEAKDWLAKLRADLKATVSTNNDYAIFINTLNYIIRMKKANDSLLNYTFPE